MPISSTDRDWKLVQESGRIIISSRMATHLRGRGNRGAIIEAAQRQSGMIMALWRPPTLLRLALALGGLLLSGQAALESQLLWSAVTDDQYQQHQVGDITFRTPPGLSIERVASSPLVQRPIVATWDDAGRLLVLESAGVIDRDAERQGSRPHRLIRLVDDNGDGSFDRRILAAEDLSFPEGVLAIGNSVLVSAPPVIWRLIDDDRDGICERREIWFDGGTWTDCYNDLHGPYLGPDGWIYWCKGAFAQQSHAEFKGKPLVSSAAHIFRRRLEGGATEAVMTGGMDNPVEVAFNRQGERFFTSTFVQHPAGGRRDAVVHAIYGGVYGKPHDPIRGHLRTGNLMPIMTHLGPAAPSGLSRLNGQSLIDDSQLFKLANDQHEEQFLVAALFNLQKVTIHRLLPDGATYRTEDRDLLLADRVDFHPTDVLEDADGSLLVIDTGGWYDLCCPSSALDQRAAVGGIYRISSPTCDRRNNARGQGLDWSRIGLAAAIDRLSDKSWWIRRQALRWIEKHAKNAENGLAKHLAQQTQSIESRLDALWCLCRIGSAEAQRIIVAALDDPHPEVRQAAALSIAVHRWPAKPSLQRLVQSDSSAAVRRAAAEALGRVGDSSTVEALMDVVAHEMFDNDRVLQHSILFAMMEIDRPEMLAKYLDVNDARQRYAAMRVLGELKSNLLSPDFVLAAVSSPDARIRELAVEMLKQNPQWSAALSQPLAAIWSSSAVNPADRVALLSIIGGWYQQGEVEQLLQSNLLAAPKATLIQQTLLVEALETTRPASLPVSWSEPLANWLDSESLPDQLRERLASWLGAVTLDSTNDPVLIRVLIRLAEARRDDLSQAINFARALPNQAELSESLTNALIDIVVDPEPDPLKSPAARLLARLKLSGNQARKLAGHLESIEPPNLLSIVTAIANVGDDSIDQQLLANLASIPGVRSMSTDALLAVYRQRGAPLRELAGQTVAAMVQPPADVEQALQELEADLAAGDPLHGMQVFRSSQANCSACHQVAYVGGQSGPDLSRIGAIRSRRELLEAIVFPNLRLEQSYRSVKILMNDGLIYNGLVERENADSLDLITGPDQRVRLAVADIDQRLPSDVSIMPSGILDSLNHQQLADLLAFLQSRR